MSTTRATPWLDDVEMRAWRSLLRAHARLIARLDADLQASQGMSVTDYGVLVQLSEEEGGRMRMSERRTAHVALSTFKVTHEGRGFWGLSA